MAEKTIPFEEVCLEGNNLLLNDYLLKIDSMSLLITWSVTNYSGLKRKVLYHQSAIDKGLVERRWTLRLLKKSRHLILILSTDAEKKDVHFSLPGALPGVHIAGGETKEVAEGLYVSEFCRTVVEDPENQLLLDDTLTVHCRYGTRPINQRFICLPYKQRRDSADMFQFCEDMRSLYTNGKYTDFVIHAGDKEFNVHKVILLARSNFFVEMFWNDYMVGIPRTELEFNTTPAAMEAILLYMYSGEWSEDFDDSSMIEVFRLVYRLKIECLLVKCRLFFENNLTIENAVRIYQAAAQCKQEDLKKKIMHYLLTTLEDPLETVQWKCIAKMEKKYADL